MQQNFFQITLNIFNASLYYIKKKALKGLSFHITILNTVTKGISSPKFSNLLWRSYGMIAKDWQTNLGSWPKFK